MARKVTYKAGLPGAEKEITVEVHELDAQPWPLGAPLKHVGTDVPRLDGMAKATGAARYTQDVLQAEKAYAGVVGCPHAHAKVVRVDLEAAQALKGVLATRSYAGSTLTYAGAAAAAVCAVSPEVLEDALALVGVTYEVLPHVVTVEDALEDKVIVSGRSNDSLKGGAGENRPGRRQRGEMKRGDPEAALQAAEVVVEAEYRTQIQTHSALEPHGSVAKVEADGSATVWASTQGTSGFASGALAQRLGVKRGDVRVITEHMGGGFGAKFGAGAWDLLCAEFASEIKRPVSYLLTRRHEHLVGGNRPDSIQRMKLGGTKDGKFEVLAGETWGTSGNGKGGANCANFSAYGWPNVLMKQHGVSTHTAMGRAFRAPGHPQGFFALESLIDRYAATIGKDPLEVRLANDPHVVRQIQWKLGAERIGWAKKRAATQPAGPIRKGVGCAAGRWGSGGRGRWIVELDISRDGHVQVRNGAQDIGTGTRTLLAILAAEELGIDPKTIDVRMGDTNFPPGPGSGGSTTAPSLGPAAREAGLRGREGLEALLRKEWGLSVDAALTWKDGVCQGPGDKSATFREACGLIGDEKLSVRGQRRPNFASFESTTAGCQFAEVSVDIETGVVKVDRVVAVHDCGRIINTLTARSQVNGGVIQGIGYALFEERQLDKNLGDMVNATFDTYRIPGMQDCPPIDVILTPVVSGINSVGMMGLGEPATVPTAGAIANAVFHAIGVQVLELPMTPARVLAALEGKAS